MRIVFMGTPEFAVPSLQRLFEDGHQVCGVFTQPDKPKNRGMKLQICPVKEYALSREIPCFQPITWKDGSALETARACNPDLIVVAAYGKILPKALLDLPKYGSINVHASLLPRYRGAAPINWAILNGDEETGITIMQMAEALDAGDIISVERTMIGPEETAEELYGRLKELGADLLSRTMVEIEAGKAVRTPQDDSKACYAPMLNRDLSPIIWSRPAAQLHCQVRGLLPWPTATTELCGVPVKIHSARLTGNSSCCPPGAVVSAGSDGIEVCCGDGKTLLITELQGQGGRKMPACAYICGHPVPPNASLS
jgi:methionyl-tRNA formyltransferase